MRPCKICLMKESRRKAIDEAIMAGVSQPTIAARFSTRAVPLDRMNVQRHKKHAFPRNAVMAAVKRTIKRPTSDAPQKLVDRVEELVKRFEDIALRSETTGQLMGATSALKEVRCSLELIGRLSGEIAPNNFVFNFTTFDWQTETRIDEFLKRSHPRVIEALTAKLVGTGPPTINITFTKPRSERPALEAPRPGG
jgi:hypothetical protein